MIRITHRFVANISRYIVFVFALKGLMVVLGLVPLFVAYLMITDFDFWFAGLFFSLCLICYVLFCMLFYSGLNRQAKKQTSAIFRPCESVFSEHGMSYKSFNFCSGINAFVPYSSFKRVVFARRHLVLVTSTVAFAIARLDIDQATHDELIKLFQKHLDPKVFSAKKVPKVCKKMGEVALVPYPAPMQTMPQITSNMHDFDRADENYFKSFSLKDRAKKSRLTAKLIIDLAVLAALAVGALLLYFLFDDSLMYARLALLMLVLVQLIAELLIFAQKTRKKPDALGRDGAQIELTINEFMITYKIISDQKTSHYFALSEITAAKETQNHFAFYVGSFQPMLLNKKHLSEPQKIHLKNLILYTMGNRFRCYDLCARARRE